MRRFSIPEITDAVGNVPAHVYGYAWPQGAAIRVESHASGLFTIQIDDSLSGVGPVCNQLASNPGVTEL